MKKDIQHLRELMEQHQRLTKEMLLDHHNLTRLLSDQRDEANQLAVKVALENITIRLSNLNELRGQLQDMIATLETKLHAEAMMAAANTRMNGLEAQIQELKQFRSNSEGRGQIIQILWPLIVGIIVFVLNKYFR